MLNIAIAEDQILFRKGLIALINTFEDVRVVIEAEDGLDMLDQLNRSQEPIHVALLDINMPGMNGMELMGAIRKSHPAIKNIILTIYEEGRYIHKLIEEGANAYLVKNALPEEVEKAIRTVVSHDYYFNEQIIRVMHSFMHREKLKQAKQQSFEITAREREVLELICKELTGPEMAKKLFISESTVNGHRNHLLAKIGCRNTAGLVLFALRHGIVQLNDTGIETSSL